MSGSDQLTDKAGDQPKRRPIRWWPVITIAAAATAALIWIRFFQEIQQQDKNIRTAIVGMLTCALLFLWSLLFSRMRWRWRLLIFGAAVTVIGSIAALFEIRGVSGDLVPIWQLRWKYSAKSAPVAPTGSASRSTNEPSPTASTRRDYPQFLGPHRNATVAGPRLARDWKAQPPVQLWRQPINAAWSGFAIAADHAITQEQHDEEELVVCYDLLSGKVLWSHSDHARYFTKIGGEGPRATPTIHGDRVLTVGATGMLNCLDLATGTTLWSKNFIEDNHSRVPEWGLSCSPLVMSNRVIVSAGGKEERSLVAYDLSDGKFVWGGGNDGAGYSSPCLATFAGELQILIFNAGNIAAHDPASGAVLWKHPWPRGHPHVSMPVALPGDRVLVSSGYGTGSELLEIKRQAADGWSASVLWKSLRLKAKFTNVIYRDGFIYGLDDGILVCLDASNGELKWKEGRYGHGQVILVADLLLLMAEMGDLILLDPVPQERRELASFPVLKGKSWNPPALAGRCLVVRNDLEAACYRLPLADGAPD